LKTQTAVTLNINRLEKLVAKGYGQAEIINLAIEKGWQGFYEPNNGSGFSKPSRRLQNNISAMNRAKELVK